MADYTYDSIESSKSQTNPNVYVRVELIHNGIVIAVDRLHEENASMNLLLRQFLLTMDDTFTITTCECCRMDMDEADDFEYFYGIRMPNKVFTSLLGTLNPVNPEEAELPNYGVCISKDSKFVFRLMKENPSQ